MDSFGIQSRKISICFNSENEKYCKPMDSPCQKKSGTIPAKDGCIEPPKAFAYRQVRFVTHTKRFFTALVIVMCQKKF